MNLKIEGIWIFWFIWIIEKEDKKMEEGALDGTSIGTSNRVGSRAIIRW